MLRTPILASLALVFASAVDAQTSKSSLGDPTARVDSIFARFSSMESPGCAVGVGQNGRTAVSRAYGMANLEYGVANTPATVFEAGSVAKQFTAAAIVLLAEQGKLSLDDLARKYVPELPDYGTPVTIRHMLNHTSGLRDWGTVVGAAGWPRGSRVHTHAHVLDVVSRQKSLNFPPGSEYSYSNTGYNLAAIIVERVSGQSFAEFTKKNIFEPLGMKSTQWRDDFTRVVKNRATAYSSGAGGIRLDMPFENVHGNGGLLTTVGDLLLWNENFTHLKVGGQHFFDELQRRARLNNGRDHTYALGLVVASYKAIPEVSHSGATAGYRAFLARYPQQRLSVAVLCNHGSANSVELAHRVADIFLGDVMARAATASRLDSTIRVAAAELAARAGVYRNVLTNEPYRIVATDSSLRVEGGGELLPLSALRFRSATGLTHATFDLSSARAPSVLRIVTSDGDTVTAVRVAATPSNLRLAGYTGEYYSDEAEVTYTVVEKDGKLVLRRRPDVAMTLTPAYTDAFTAQQLGLVLFRRDNTGKVSGMSFGMGRVRDLLLSRVSR
ncbi:MAG: serine hydrolase [Gemmatimonadaceae bacterium]